MDFPGDPTAPFGFSPDSGLDQFKKLFGPDFPGLPQPTPINMPAMAPTAPNNGPPTRPPIQQAHVSPLAGALLALAGFAANRERPRLQMGTQALGTFTQGLQHNTDVQNVNAQQGYQDQMERYNRQQLAQQNLLQPDSAALGFSPYRLQSRTASLPPETTIDELDVAHKGMINGMRSMSPDLDHALTQFNSVPDDMKLAAAQNLVREYPVFRPFSLRGLTQAARQSPEEAYGSDIQQATHAVPERGKMLENVAGLSQEPAYHLAHQLRGLSDPAVNVIATGYRAAQGLMANMGRDSYLGAIDTDPQTQKQYADSILVMRQGLRHISDYADYLDALREVSPNPQVADDLLRRIYSLQDAYGDLANRANQIQKKLYAVDQSGNLIGLPTSPPLDPTKRGTSVERTGSLRGPIQPGPFRPE